jgi:hypothetical protein
MKANAAFFAGALLSVLCSSSQGKAEETASANNVMAGCRHFVANDNNDYLLQGVCAGILIALRDYAGSCAPPGVTTGQAVRVVVQFIDSHPARMHESFTLLAAEALRAAWPCH